MIVDALVLVDPHLKLAKRIHDSRRFLRLNGWITNDVERSTEPVCWPCLPMFIIHPDPACRLCVALPTRQLEGACNITHRIRTHNLYMLVDKPYLPWDSQRAWN